MSKKKSQETGAIRGNILIISLIVLLVFIIDRVSKYLALHYLTEKVGLIPKLLSLTFAVNTGAGFGVFKGMTLFLSVFSFIVIAFILFNLKSIAKERYFWAVALILGGAIGNLFDRVFYSFVIDFIKIPFWPVFNIADAAISIGAVALVVYLIIGMKKR